MMQKKKKKFSRAINNNKTKLKENRKARKIDEKKYFSRKNKIKK